MSLDLWWFAYIALGAFVGFMAGMLGIGGGGILVPMLTIIFTHQGFPASSNVHMALGTSMASILLTSISSARAHHRHGAVNWPVVFSFAPGIVLGALGGAFLAARLSAQPLTVFFGCFMLYIAWRMVSTARPSAARHLPGKLWLALTGLGIGILSALVSIGGGTIIIPFLVWCNVPMPKAIGTSAATGFFVALAGTTGYLLNGHGVEGMPPGSVGFVYLPGLALVALASIWTAPLGARMAHRMPVVLLKRVFAVVLLVISAKMLHLVFAS